MYTQHARKSSPVDSACSSAGRSVYFPNTPTPPLEVFPLMSGSPLDRRRFLAATDGELMGFTATHADALSLFEVV